MIGGWGDLRLAPTACAVWAVSLVAWHAGPTPAALAAAACCVVAGAAVACRSPASATRRRCVREGIAPVLALAAVGATAAALTASAAVEARAWIAAHADHALEITGTVTEVRAVASAWSEPRVAVRIEVDARRAAGEPWRHARGLVVVVTDAGGAPARGSDARARGVVAPAGPGAVDALLAGEVVGTAPPTGWRAALERMRTGFLGVLDGPGTEAALVAGMVLGDTSRIPQDVIGQMRMAGLAHLTAVSGAHFAILAAALGAVMRRMRAAPLVVACVTVSACGGFALTVTGGGSVLRALAMAAIGAGALVAGRRGQPMPALSTAVIVLILLRPELARDAGLALSVAAVLAITQLAPALASRLRRRVAAPLADAAAVTVAAQAACLPVLAAIDASVGPWAVAANAVAAPFAVPVTLLGAGALVLAVPVPALAAVLASAASWCAWPVVLAARAFALVPGGGWASATGLRGVVLGSLACAAIVWTARASQGTRVAALIALIATAVAHAPVRWLPESLGGAIDGWTVVACDVGQGDALVMRGGGAVVMVDVGPAGDAAARCLDRIGVSRLDLLVLTHEHADHTGGLAEVLDAAAVARVWPPPGASDATRAALARVPSEEPTAGLTWAGGVVAVEVLQSGPAPRGRGGTEVNDSSTVVRIAAEGLVVVALGDVELSAQRRLARAASFVDVDVVKAAHHGSATQDPGLVREIAAPVAILSVGEGNDYGHPAAEALALYGERGAAVLRTDLCGDVVLGARDGAPVLVRRCRDPVAP
ncbi:ComEC/Rec2 family competence protein [Demequina gelatinilytica]|uniref:ComEC/Rec2 family competence protein n=1 Tax=Demequina gelatinilytica TaxID=1638980 RepID=UPI0007860E9D|nr:ComEC/Rec2 family competence protein [Demequina gelatinilytica]